MVAGIAHGGMNPRIEQDKARSSKGPPKELDHLRVSEAENGGHLIESHFTHYEHPAEQHVFGPHEDGDAKPMLPKGHPLEHIAKAMHMPHSVIEEKNESASATDAKGHAPTEEEEIEEE